MTYRLEITRRAEKDLKAISEEEAAKIHKAIMALRAGLAGDVKKLVNHVPEYRLRVGSWRVLFAIEKDTIVIARVLDRKEAYRN
ncbi:MAG TPA: type II toxin-antitoxin system RelE/ParE family toxin [Planctomycetota bacterium]|jgi:mRNA interferase RelE/StbE